MTHIRSVLLAFVAAVAVGAIGSACGPEQVSIAGPRLVWVSPGLWLVEGYPTAVYFSDGFYWQYTGGYWYRSPYYDRAFVRVDLGIVPRHIAIGHNPRDHRNYRAPREAYVRPIDRATQRPIIRDHRPRRR